MAGRLRSLVAEGVPAFGVSCTVGAPLLAEIASAEGCDYVCADMQHGVTDLSGLPALLSAISACGSTSPLVRVLRAEAAEIGKALDCGAEGVIVPMVNKAREAELAVQACRYPPEGVRSFGPFRAEMYLHRSRTLDEVNREALCFAMVETGSGIEHLDEICATDGLSGIYVGPSDLTLALGGNPRSSGAPASLSDHLVRIADACRDRGLIPGIHARNLREAERYLDLGFIMITLGTDAALFRRVLGETLTGARQYAAAESRSRS